MKQIKVWVLCSLLLVASTCVGFASNNDPTNNKETVCSEPATINTECTYSIEKINAAEVAWSDIYSCNDEAFYRYPKTKWQEAEFRPMVYYAVALPGRSQYLSTLNKNFNVINCLLRFEGTVENYKEPHLPLKIPLCSRSIC